MFCIYTLRHLCFIFFFFNDTATTEIYTLSLHDALPISLSLVAAAVGCRVVEVAAERAHGSLSPLPSRVRTRHRSEEHTSELQSPCNLVCRLLLEKKKKKTRTQQCPTAHLLTTQTPAATS